MDISHSVHRPRRTRVVTPFLPRRAHAQTRRDRVGCVSPASLVRRRCHPGPPRVSSETATVMESTTGSRAGRRRPGRHGRRQLVGDGAGTTGATPASGSLRTSASPAGRSELPRPRPRPTRGHNVSITTLLRANAGCLRRPKSPSSEALERLETAAGDWARQLLPIGLPVGSMTNQASPWPCPLVSPGAVSPAKK